MKLNINDIYGIGQSIAISRAKDICKQIRADELSSLFDDVQLITEKQRNLLDAKKDTVA